MTSVMYSLSGDFTDGLNIDKLTYEIQTNAGITTTLDGIYNQGGDTLVIRFQSPLGTEENTFLDTVVSEHVGTSYPRPYQATEVLNNGDIFVASHFYDLANKRRIKIKEIATDTTDIDTFRFESGLTADYTISSNTGQIFQNTFMLVGTTYQIGSNIAPTGTAAASTSTNPASSANDDNTTTFWYNTTAEPPVGSWWQVDFGTVKGVLGAELVNYTTSYYPTGIDIYKSDNGTSWTKIQTNTSMTYTSAGNTTGSFRFPDFSSAQFARYFRFTCTGSFNATYNIAREYRLFEAAGNGYSTSTPSTISNIKANRQIDTSNWAQINSSSLVGTVPAGTSVKILLSFDNQTTWVYWNGSAWTTSSLANIQTTSMSHTTFNALTTANYNASGGLNSGTKTLDAAASISTTDATKTPAVQKLVFNTTTNSFQKEMSKKDIMVKMIMPNKTQFQNVSGSNKTLNIVIS